jgi:hypothetical protein
MNRRKTWLPSGLITLVLAAAVILAFPIIYGVALHASEKTVTLTVEDKDSVTVSNGDQGSKNEYRVYTDRGVYKVVDSIFYLDFRAADRYAALKVGRTYACKQAGWRIGIVSAFPNLIECEET